MGEFSDKVFEQVRRIPSGKVATYGQIARLIGAPRSARYVGHALRANPDPGDDPDSIPCHRVVFKDGHMATGFAFGGPEIQKEMLVREGVIFADDEHVDMAQCLWSAVDESFEQVEHDCATCTRDCPDRGHPERRGAQPSGPLPDFDWERELGED